MLHWSVACLVLIQFVLGFEAHGLPVSMERFVLLVRHKSFGICVLALTLLRLTWRMRSPAPRLPSMSPWASGLARGSHLLLYILLLLLPLSGWLLSSASNLTVSWFGLVSLPNLTHADEHNAALLRLTHDFLAWSLLAVVVLHVSAAAWHHFVLKDDVLARMTPFSRQDRRE